MRILIADDHALFRDGLRSLLTAQGHDVIGEAKNGREAVALVRELAPEMVLMDLSMPEMDGLAATRLITAEMPAVKVLILTASESDATLFEAIKSGAQGYLIKNLEADDFFALLDRAASGEPAFTPTLARKLLLEFAKPAEPSITPDQDALTARERDVLELMVEGVVLIARGLTNREIGSEIYVSENTVKFHVRNILDKLHLHNRAEAVGYTLRKRIDPNG
jgi:DNA-binding NarL/FixJ family response regulator